MVVGGKIRSSLSIESVEYVCERLCTKYCNSIWYVELCIVSYVLFLVC